MVPSTIHKESRLVVLGSGTGVPVKGRRPAGHLVQYAGRGLLLDLGPGAWHAATRYVRFSRIDYVLLSHPHPDHCLDSLALLFTLSLTPGRRPGPTLMASRETLLQVERWVRATPGLSMDLVPIRPLEAGERVSLWDGVTLTTGTVAHVAGSLAYRLDFPDGASLTYSGDTTWCLTLVQLAYRTTVLLLECAHREPSKPHLWPESAATLARWAEAELTVLTHFYPDALTPAFRRQCRRFFSTPFVLARDGGTYPIRRRLPVAEPATPTASTDSMPPDRENEGR
jgi:ribonuclease BN (tRNA processing enzyme)